MGPACEVSPVPERISAHTDPIAAVGRVQKITMGEVKDSKSEARTLGLHHGQRTQIGGHLLDGCGDEFDRQHMPSGRWPLSAREFQFGAGVTSVFDGFRRNQKNEEIGFFDRVTNVIVETAPGRQVLPVEKHLMPKGL